MRSLSFKSKGTEKAYHLAEHGDLVIDEVVHVVVFGVKDKFAVPLIKALDGGAVLYERDDYVAAVGGFLFFNYYLIAVEHAYLYHGIALYGQHEQVAVAEEIGGDGKVIVVIFLREDGLAGGDGAEEGNFDDVLIYGNGAALVLAHLIL